MGVNGNPYGTFQSWSNHVTVTAGQQTFEFSFPGKIRDAAEEGMLMDAITAALLAVNPDLDVTGIEFSEA